MKSGNWIINFWSALFVTPIICCLILQEKMMIRSFNYFGAIIMLYYGMRNWSRIKNNEITISRSNIYIFFIMVLISFLYSLLSKYYAFQLNAYDFGIFQSILEGIINHNFGYSSVVGFYHFGTHQNYILFLIAPIYNTFHSAATLQTIIAIVIWLTAVVIWFICQFYQLNNFYCFIIILTFLLSPMNGLDNNFMPETFLPLFFSLVYLFYLQQKLFYYTIAIILSLSVKEDATLYILGFGGFLLYSKSYKYAIITILFALMCMYLNLKIIQPYFVHKSHMLEPTTLNYWSQWGSNKSEIFINLLTHPLDIIKQLFDSKSGIYRLYLPLLLLPFFVPEVLLASILIILMFATSNNPTIHSYKSYYAITLNLIAFIGIIKIMSDLNKYASRIKALFLIALVIFPLWGTGWQNFWYFDYKVFINYTYLENYLHQNQLKSQKLCPQSNLYPMILASGFATTTFDNSGYYFSKQHDCLMILTKYGNLYPFNLQQVNQQILLFNCSSFKNFYLCTR